MNYGYWYFLPTGELCYELSWKDGNIDYLRLHKGNVFRTKEEALTKGKEIMEQIKKESKRKTRIMKNIEKYKEIVLGNLNSCSISARLCRKIVNGYCEGFSCEGCGERVLKWLLEEAKEQVLDDVEKEYLSAVIKPFRKKVMDVVKVQYVEGKQRIRIRVSYGDCAELPFFKNNTMYKGMKVGKYYTLEELGL